jgi:hypothetical protein
VVVSAANPASIDQAVDMLQLTSRASELFLQQPTVEQRRLLRVVIEKAAWQNGTLRTTLFEPFEILRHSNQESYRNEKEKAGSAGFDVDRTGVYAQQQISLGRHMIVNYGYKIERSHTYDTGPDPIFDVRLRIASLTATFTRDTRDDLLDATRGSFFSHAMQFSPESLGSQVRFIKYFGQYFRYFPLQKTQIEQFTGQVMRPRLVYATGVRIGVGTGLGGQEIPLSERFFAGGSTTIRGFAQNSVGPETGGIVLPGGNGMLVLNNELRFPMFKLLDGVGFVDVGNVYPKVSDFSLGNVRSAAGMGLRVRTPWFLLRAGLRVQARPPTRGNARPPVFQYRTGLLRIASDRDLTATPMIWWWVSRTARTPSVSWNNSGTTGKVRFGVTRIQDAAD